MARRPRAPVPRRVACSAIASRASSAELELDAVELEQPLVLAHERVLRLGEHLHERLLVQAVAPR